MDSTRPDSEIFLAPRKPAGSSDTGKMLRKIARFIKSKEGRIKLLSQVPLAPKNCNNTFEDMIFITHSNVIVSTFIIIFRKIVFENLI